MLNVTLSFSCELQDREGAWLPGQRLCASGVLWECTPLPWGSCPQGSPPAKETPTQTPVPGALCHALVVRDTSLQLREGTQASPGCAQSPGVWGVSERAHGGRDGGTGSPHPSCSIHPSIR